MNVAGWLWGIVDWSSLPMVAVAAGIFVWRRLHPKFPIFFAYLVATATAGVVSLAARPHGPRVYFYAYWISNIVVGVFNVLVVCEVFGLRLFPLFYKVGFYRRVFTAASVVILLGGWLTALESGNKGQALIVRARAVDFIVVAMLVFFVFLMLVMGRTWGRHDFAIVSGLVVSSAGSLMASAMWVRTHYKFTPVQHLVPITFGIACLIWLNSFWSKEKVSVPASPSLRPEMLQEARRWESALKDWLMFKKRTPRDADR